MDIRRLTQSEKFEAGLISTVSFHGRIDNMEERRAEWTADNKEAWGAFDDDNKMMAHINNNRFQCYFDGHVIENGGIGGVSTLPEYRESGAIRAIFQQLLPAARENGEVISTLFPFRHSFYRKFGYETACYGGSYEIPTNELKREHHKGWAKMWRPGDSTQEYTALYEKFASRYNCAILRDDTRMSKVHVKGDCYKDRYFCYLLGDESGASAYVAFQDASPKIAVKDFAWDGRRGFKALLGFLSRFSADYRSISIEFPGDLELLPFFDNPYNVTRNPRKNYMVRVVNAEKLLALMKKPAGAVFTVKLADEMIPANNGTWKVFGDTVAATDVPADIELSERALACLVLGVADLHEFSLRDDVEIHGNEEVLSSVFIRKPLYVADYF